MSGTTISSAANAGIVLIAASDLPLIITDTGSIFAGGLYESGIYAPITIPAAIYNSGIVNGAGYGINLHDGGRITNGSTVTPGALVTGGYDGILTGARAAVSITNYGTVASNNLANGNGINAGGAARIVNGSVADASALISGYFNGVFAGGTATVTNYGTIAANGTSTALGQSSVGVYLRSGGRIVNGGPANTSATILAPDFAVQAEHGPATVGNFGTIVGTGPIGRGVLLANGGSVANGTTQDTAATISAEGKNGVYCGGTAASTVTNMGTIAGAKNGIALQCGGTVINGARTSTAALISGARQGVYIEGLVPSFLANSGTIQSTGQYWGVSIYLRGSVVNGGPTNPAALITGGGGVYNGGIANLLNYGSILASSRPAVEFVAGGAVTNYGTIVSSTGTAVTFGNANSLLAVAPGAVFGGKAVAGSGNNVLELLASNNAGIIADPNSNFVDFPRLKVDNGADWTVTGTSTFATITVTGTLTVQGSLDIAGTLAPANAGALAFANAATIEVGSVLGQGPPIRFLHNDTLTIDTISAFGTGIGTPAAIGPLLQRFDIDDSIDLRNLPQTGTVIVAYATATGELTISVGGPVVADLFFDPSSLASGSFHTGPDGVGGTLLTHR